jgi:hypothetical protein
MSEIGCGDEEKVCMKNYAIFDIITAKCRF